MPMVDAWERFHQATLEGKQLMGKAGCTDVTRNLASHYQVYVWR